MDRTVLFWILIGGLGFGFALAVQMRMMIALVLRRALKAWNDVFEDRIKANQAVMLAARPTPDLASDDADLLAAATHLRETYPNPLAHLQTARRYSLILPVLLLAVLALGRAALGVI